MTTLEKISLQLPLLTFDSTYASSQAAKQAIDPFGKFRPTGFAPFPQEGLKVIGFGIFRQNPWWIPPGYYGDVPWAVDPGAYFTRIADYPEREDADPFNLNPLGEILIEPGASRRERFIHDPPIIIRPGDLIISAPQNNNKALADAWAWLGFGPTFTFVATLAIESITGPFKLEDGVVWAVPLNDAAQGGTPACIRTVVPDAATGGSEVWVNLRAGGYGCTYKNASIGLQSSGPNMIDAPVPLVLPDDGAPVDMLTLAPHGNQWVKATLAAQPGRSLVINLGVMGSRAWKRVAPIGAHAWGSEDFDSIATANMGGTITSDLPRRAYCFDCVKRKVA